MGCHCHCNSGKCVQLPTPKNATKKGLKSYRKFIWWMFGFMFVIYLTCVPLVFTFVIGSIIVPTIILSFIFTLCFTPSCKTAKYLRSFHRVYAKKVFRYNMVNWVLGASTFIFGIVASSMFNYYYGAYSYYEECIAGPYYYYSKSYSDTGLHWSYDSYCTVANYGFVFSIITCVLALAQLIFIVVCLGLQDAVLDEIERKGCQPELGINSIDAVSMDELSTDSDYRSKKSKKSKNNKENNDPRVDQLVYAMQGMFAQLGQLQGNYQQGNQNQQQNNPDTRSQMQMTQQIQPQPQAQPQTSAQQPQPQQPIVQLPTQPQYGLYQ
eukprot:gnl/Chilomastix_caulleri/584.p1 GENE.gnl/Chilomastix_caulleri/584~~gnl/Chilomastix_caulleri/584.p1  ORF type:complete len:323 (+),score=62.96 gnl/Chilomastix_caulleri/584:167-1135(+)